MDVCMYATGEPQGAGGVRGADGDPGPHHGQ